MRRSGIVILLLMILYEGFSLLPEHMVVLPGVFRMRDAFLVMLPLFFLLCGGSVLRAWEQYRAESRLVLTITVLVLVGPLMAQLFFGQPYLTGLLFIRHSLVWLSFFFFVAFLRDLESADRFLRTLTVLVGIWLILLIVTKYLPNLGIIHVKHGYYGDGTMMRFGEHRLYFPYGAVPVYLYCYALAKLLHGAKEGGIMAKTVSIAFVGLVFYAVTSSFTRVLIVSLVLVTLYALATCQRRILRLLAFALAGGVVTVQAMGMAMGTGGFELIEQSNLGKLVLQQGSLETEYGRRLQLQMNLENFLKSPLSGVGNLVSGRSDDYERNPNMRTYRKYGFFNASDTGYPKMAAEYGLLGLFWLAWYYRHALARSKGLILGAQAATLPPEARVIAYGSLYYTIHLLVSGVTLPHFVTPDGIVIVALSLAILAITRRSLEQSQAAAPAGSGA